ncbi:DUF1294 domain-containing protein [Evtepia sp.]|nr:DUF1294 domain-containing protein [Candidatus Evtepia faecavium]
MSPYLLLWILVWTILAFALMGIDKWKAKREAWRVPEKVLFLSALAGGSIGALAGMALFRHKTLHWSFRIGMPAILVLQVVLLALWSFRDLWWG